MSDFANRLRAWLQSQRPSGLGARRRRRRVFPAQDTPPGMPSRGSGAPATGGGGGPGGGGPGGGGPGGGGPGGGGPGGGGPGGGGPPPPPPPPINTTGGAEFSLPFTDAGDTPTIGEPGDFVIALPREGNHFAPAPDSPYNLAGSEPTIRPCTGGSDQFANLAIEPTWTVLRGEWSETQNKLVDNPTGVYSGQSVIQDGCVWSDGSATATVTNPEAGDTGVAARTSWDGTLSGYAFVYSSFDTAWFIVRYDADAATQLSAGHAGPIVTGQVIGIEVAGTSITATVDGAPVLNVTDATYTSGKAALLKSTPSGARFTAFTHSHA